MTTFVNKPTDRFTAELARKERRKAVSGGRAKLWNIPRGWAHQGFFYLDRTQRIGRVILEIVPTFGLAWLISWASGISLSNVWLWIGSLIVTHTLNWVFNCNWWAGMLFTFPNWRNPGEQGTCDYLNRMRSRLKADEAISGVMIFGSVARGQWHDRSDLDMRLLRCRGCFHGIAGVLILLRERVMALFARQPLDIYLSDGTASLMKMRKDEPPVFLKKDDPRLDRLYPDGQETEIRTLKADRSERAFAQAHAVS